jgi:hypothetical protein
LLGGGNSHRDDLDFDYPDLASQTRSEDDKGSYIKGHPRCGSLFYDTILCKTVRSSAYLYQTCKVTVTSLYPGMLVYRLNKSHICLHVIKTSHSLTLDLALFPVGIIPTIL